VDQADQAYVVCLHAERKRSIVPPATCCFTVATPTATSETHIALNMTISVVDTYEEDSHIAVARHIASLLDEGQVGVQTTL
jgi:hypothetical protein